MFCPELNPIFITNPVINTTTRDIKPGCPKNIDELNPSRYG
jgi:hypothetical protein